MDIKKQKDQIKMFLTQSYTCKVFNGKQAWTIRQRGL
jgi:hypothetical protein